MKTITLILITLHIVAITSAQDGWYKGVGFAQGYHGHFTETANGNLYWSSQLDRQNAIWEYVPSTNTCTQKIVVDSKDGLATYGSLVLAKNQKLYGMTLYGGTNNGVIFEYDPATNVYTKKIDFDYFKTGGKPWGDLMQATNGKFYGLTSSGGGGSPTSGINGGGTLFEYDAEKNTITVLYIFDALNFNGVMPLGCGALVQANNGKLYGTAGGGKNYLGVLFEYDLKTKSYTKKFDFSKATGSTPTGGLIQANNGKLYGMTSWGGANDRGVLYEYDIDSNMYTVRLNFEASIGINPSTALVKGNNGKLYGTTATGGKTNCGVLFEYDPTANTYEIKNNFEQYKTGRCNSTLTSTANGKLYGVGQSMGYFLFEYDPSTEKIVVKKTQSKN